MNHVARLSTIPELRQFVLEILCAKDNLDPAQTPLQQARVMYTALGDDKSRANTARALERVAPFLRRQIGGRLRLKRAPELKFVYDESVAGQDRIEQILHELHVQSPTDPESDE